VFTLLLLMQSDNLFQDNTRFTYCGKRPSTAWKTVALGSNGAFPHLEFGLRRRFWPEIVVLAKTRRFIFVIFVHISSFSSISLGICANAFSV
ncbi:MAG TPA: hypothetical protein PK388_04110, partial [Kiritimatiellia bacterium]|nr:hypothetical protein [Kiritimatiellia bacterium]